MMGGRPTAAPVPFDDEDDAAADVAADALMDMIPSAAVGCGVRLG